MRVYTFGNGTAEGGADMQAELGGKGAGLANMCRLGVPVPPGFTISTTACQGYFEAGDTFPDILADELERGLAHLEETTGLGFGLPERPLLVSVRSGAEVSMPGMMDTVLNVGVTDATMVGLHNRGGERFAFDSQRRFLEMFGEIALGVDGNTFAGVRDEVLSLARTKTIGELSVDWLKGLVNAYLRALDSHKIAVPACPREQLRASIVGVFKSWNTRRAKRYRQSHGISDSLGTAVTVQAMVFGNIGDGSSTGVAFTRDPNTGQKGLFGEYLPKAQGEDVVSGRFTPKPLAGSEDSLEFQDAKVYAELQRVGELLESHFGDVQDLEFTVESGRLWMLQTRTAKRTARAAVRIAVDFESEGLITRDEALLRVKPQNLVRLLHPSVDMNERRRVVAKGLPASPGAVSGRAAFDSETAIALTKQGEKIILVRVETSTEDMEAIRQVAGVLTSRGGMTSHAALVARGLGRPCVTGCSDIMVDERRRRFRVRNGNVVVEEGAGITIDGSTGEVILGQVATSTVAPPEAFDELLSWADDARTLGVRGNADNAIAVKKALESGADGIGLCCTEHMFLDEDHLGLVREMILAYDARTRRRVVDHILPVQREDFLSLLQSVNNQPVSIRLLDIPLHDLMPEDSGDLGSIAQRLESTVERLSSRAGSLLADNPLLGHRGCRLGLTFPELYEVQIRALFEAVIDIRFAGRLQVVIPFVSAAEEMNRLRRRIMHMATMVCSERGVPVPEFEIGAMIESPRACLVAGHIAEHSDFLLFGTNDLTIGTFLLNRDDAGRFLPFYLENGVLPADPFVCLDMDGVGVLISTAVERAREIKPDIEVGLAGTHSNHPDTIRWCCAHGINYVTCAPHRLPMVRLAAGQAVAERKLS